MELSSLIPCSQPMPLVLPDGSPSDVVLHVVGKESDRFHTASFKWLQHMQAREQKLTLAEMAEMQADLVASLIVGWGGLTSGGVPIPYTHAKAVELVKNPGLTYMREQVEAFADQRSNFFRPGASSADLSGSSAGAAEYAAEGRDFAAYDPRAFVAEQEADGGQLSEHQPD